MMQRITSAVASLACCAGVLCGCSGGDVGTSNGMRTDAAPQLQTDVLALTHAAAAKNWQGARPALATLRADLDASISAGAIPSKRAAVIKAAAAKVAGDL